MNEKKLFGKQIGSEFLLSLFTRPDALLALRPDQYRRTRITTGNNTPHNVHPHCNETIKIKTTTISLPLFISMCATSASELNWVEVQVHNCESSSSSSFGRNPFVFLNLFLHYFYLRFGHIFLSLPICLVCLVRALLFFSLSLLLLYALIICTENHYTRDERRGSEAANQRNTKWIRSKPEKEKKTD